MLCFYPYARWIQIIYQKTSVHVIGVVAIRSLALLVPLRGTRKIRNSCQSQYKLQPVNSLGLGSPS